MRYAPLASAALAALVLCGCSSSEETPDEPTPDGPAIVLPRKDEPRIEVDFQKDWEDIDRNDKGELDPEEVAAWVVERRNAVQRCLRIEPQAVGQAVELLEQIISKVADSSRDRYLLAQCVFSEAAYWFRLADVYAWEMNRLELDRTAHASDGGQKLTDEEVKAKVAELRRTFDLLLVNVNKTSQRALNLFTVYRQQRPDDKSVYDYIWKLHFYSQNFVEAQRWLDLVIHEMDLAGVPEQDPLRRDYVLLRREIVDRITEQRLGQFTPVKPMVRDQMRLSEAHTRPPGSPK